MEKEELEEEDGGEGIALNSEEEEGIISEDENSNSVVMEGGEQNSFTGGMNDSRMDSELFELNDEDSIINDTSINNTTLSATTELPLPFPLVIESEQFRSVVENEDKKIELLTSLRNELYTSFEEMSSRGLYQSANWVIELCNSLPEVPFSEDQILNNNNNKNATKLTVDEIQEYKEKDKILVAKSQFDLKEYARCAHTLKTCQSNKAIFIKNYSLYLLGERSKQETLLETSDPNTINENLKTIYAELTPLYNNTINNHNQNQNSSSSSIQLDTYNLYLYSLVLSHLHQPLLSVSSLILSLSFSPSNFSSWKLLSSLSSSFPSSPSSPSSSLYSSLPPHIFRDIFLSFSFLELHQSFPASHILSLLTAHPFFATSSSLLSSYAVSLLNLSQNSLSEKIFHYLFHTLDPYRLNDLDIYSNLLYSKPDISIPELSFLAHQCAKIDRYRPETNIIIGNYYSRKREHELSILYFSRAVSLDEGYGSGWTLMGHEYVECKNYNKAIEVYRKAVQVNEKDYRAWYALGQTFEILKMSGKAVYYYQNAAKWRKEDSRMWSALGECFGAIGGREREAVKAWKKAKQTGDKERIATGKIAQCFREMGQERKAAKWFRRNVDEKEQERKIRKRRGINRGGGGGGGGGGGEEEGRKEGEEEREMEELVEGWSFLANYEYEKGLEEEEEEEEEEEFEEEFEEKNEKEVLEFGGRRRRRRREGAEERWKKAKEWCWKLMDVVGKQREMAKKLLIEIENKLEEFHNSNSNSNSNNIKPLKNQRIFSPLTEK